MFIVFSQFLHKHSGITAHCTVKQVMPGMQEIPSRRRDGWLHFEGWRPNKL